MIWSLTKRVWKERLHHTSVATISDLDWAYLLAILMGISLLGSSLSVLYHITSIVGGSGLLGTVVVGAIGLGTIMAIRARLEVGLGAVAGLFTLGLGGYLVTIPDLYEAVISLELIADTVALLLGDMSLLQILHADLWAVLIAPAPVCGTWFLLLRRRYGPCVWIGGAPLMFFTLTGDASELVTLLGATSAVGVLGFGTLDRIDGSWQRIREVGMLLAAVIVLTRLSEPLFDRIAPAPEGTGSGQSTTDSQTQTIEGSLIGTSGRIDIAGKISLSPEQRFTVAVDEPGYWHVGAFDRFTGRGWVRTGVPTEYTEPLPAPFGQSRTLHQVFEAESRTEAMPAAWKPIQIGLSVADTTLVTELGSFESRNTFEPGNSYTVVSERVEWTEKQLRSIEGRVAESIQRRYLQLPADTPERIDRFAVDLTRELETRYGQAVRVQRWLKANKNYSLKISRPSGNIADKFLFEMDQGYCTYFATAMTILLRTLDIPARLVVGYTTGQAIGTEKWEIRGLNSHAWVQVYFNQFGWITFDPTPSRPRLEARQQRLEKVDSLVDAGGSVDQTGQTATSTQTESPSDQAPAEVGRPTIPTPRGDESGTPTMIGDLDLNDPPDESGPLDSIGLTRRGLFTDLSDQDRLALFAGLIGVSLGLSRLGLLSRVSRLLRINWQARTGSPKRDIERAIVRMDLILGQQYYERKPNQTMRSYLESIGHSELGDDRLLHILERYEQARYQGDASRELADEIIELVNGYVADQYLMWSPIQRLFGQDKV